MVDIYKNAVTAANLLTVDKVSNTFKTYLINAKKKMMAVEVPDKESELDHVMLWLTSNSWHLANPTGPYCAYDFSFEFQTVNTASLDSIILCITKNGPSVCEISEQFRGTVSCHQGSMYIYNDGLAGRVVVEEDVLTVDYIEKNIKSETLVLYKIDY